MSDENSRPLIISGAPRSGTSLLYNLFDAHPDVNWLVDEGFLFEYLHDIDPEGTSIFLDAIPECIDEMVTGLRDKQVMPPAHLPYKQSKARGSVSEVEIQAPWNEHAFRQKLSSDNARSIEELWRALAQAYIVGMNEPVRRYACMKSPDYGKSTTGALQNIETAVSIVIIRDPLYAIDSLKRSRELRGEKLLTWPLLAQNIRNFQLLHERIRNVDPARCRIVRYETLLATPRKVMTDLADWLGINFDDCLLQPTMRGQHWPGLSSFQQTSGIEKGPSERTIQALSSDEQQLIRSHLRELRTKFSY